MLNRSRILLCAFALCVPATLSLALAAATTTTSKTEAVHSGQEVFTSRCLQCHAIQPNQVRLGPSLYAELKKPHPKKSETEIREILKNGKGKMPAFGDRLTKEETDNLIAYLHTL